MTSLILTVPDVEVLLALAPEELGPILLKVAVARRQNELIHVQAITAEIDGDLGHGAGYPKGQRKAATLAIGEAWNWLLVTGLIIPDTGMNGANGYMRLSRRAEKIIADGSIAAYARSVGFPKSLLHHRIAEAVWLDLARGELETAVFKAFRAVEIAVREAGGFADTDIGVPLMRKAFDQTSGKLSDLSQPEAERAALAHLFSGAIGSYKNPHSHRTVTITDPSEAQEMALLASHLLRIVDARRP